MVPSISVAAAAALCLAALTALAAQAQPATPATRPDPLDPQASVPALRYASSLTQHRRLADDKPTGWREANDTVTRIGGWRAYAREAQQPASAPGSHGGHATPRVTAP